VLGDSYRKPIECRRNTSWKFGLEIGVQIVVCEMNEVCALGADLVSNTQ
jgi:hypothetical protein